MGEGSDHRQFAHVWPFQRLESEGTFARNGLCGNPSVVGDDPGRDASGFTNFLLCWAHKGVPGVKSLKTVFATVVAFVSILCPARAEDYRAYAETRVAALADGVVFREDLETLLDARASAYRRKKHRRAVTALPDFETAARAQALDMMARGRSGHLSAKGVGFQARFKAFQLDPKLHYNAGENAASDRRRGPADEEKALRLFELWVQSSGHRENLLNERYLNVSSGVVQRGSELWAVQIFWSEPIKTNMIFQ